MRLFSFSLFIVAFAVLAHAYLYRRAAKILALSGPWKGALAIVLAAMTLLLVFRRALRSIVRAGGARASERYLLEIAD